MEELNIQEILFLTMLDAKYKSLHYYFNIVI